MEDLNRRVRELETQNAALLITLRNAASMAHSAKNDKGRGAKRKKAELVDYLDGLHRWLKYGGAKDGLQ